MVRWHCVLCQAGLIKPAELEPEAVAVGRCRLLCWPPRHRPPPCLPAWPLPQPPPSRPTSQRLIISMLRTPPLHRRPASPHPTAAAPRPASSSPPCLRRHLPSALVAAPASSAPLRARPPHAWPPLLGLLTSSYMLVAAPDLLLRAQRNALPPPLLCPAATARQRQLLLLLRVTSSPLLSCRAVPSSCHVRLACE